MAKFNNYGEKYISVKFGSKIGMAPLKVWEVMDTQRDLFEKYNGMELFKAEAITYTVPVGTAVGISSFNIPLLKDNKSKSIVLAVGSSVVKDTVDTVIVEKIKKTVLNRKGQGNQ